MSSWIDAQGRLVFVSDSAGYTMERAAFEIAHENFRRRDTARVARNSAASEPGSIVPVTALSAGIRAAPPARARMRVRTSRGDTLDITQASELAAHAAPYRLPYRDSSLADWLAPEPLIQSHDPRIAAQARQIIGRERSPARVAELLAHWVSSSLQRAAADEMGVPSAARVLQERKGDCNEAATLFVALARSTGLPARTVSGLLYVNGRFYYHAWAEVYLSDWVPVDPTFDQLPADASRIPFAVGGLARQVELVPRIGRLTLEVL
jgi:transglutaminase-like putative cysteine protease